MQIKTDFLVAGLLCGFMMSSYAQDDIQVSRSAGKPAGDGSIELMSVVRHRQPVLSPAPDSDQTRDLNSPQGLANRPGMANRFDQQFSVSDADVYLMSDLDGDGYHHALNVFFDVDTSYDDATVYARLYLSHNGGPWRYFYTTDLFEIYAEDYEDAYEVATELLEGYVPGYYDILIEVFSLDHADMVASQILDHFYLGRDVPLEDLSRDRSEEYYYEEEYFYSEGGGGSFPLDYLLLILLVVIAARGASSVAPEK
jgi:hypothetical protein